VTPPPPTGHDPEVERRLGQLSAILESSADAIFSLDRDGLITSWNSAAAVMAGYRERDVAGWRATRLFPEDDWEEQEVVLRRVFAGETTQAETRVLRRDGGSVPALLTVSPIRDGAGSVIGASVIARDLTEQKLALATLVESEARLREREALARTGGWVLDVETGTVQWSAELHRMHGLDPVDFDGTLAAHVALVHDDDRAAVEGAVAHAVAGERLVDLDYRVVRPDGAVVWLHCRAAPVREGEGPVVGVRGVCREMDDGERP
jgi:PAS domain S-box-containing protein